MPVQAIPILADADAIVTGLIMLFVVFGWIVKGIKALNEKPPAMGGRQANAAPARDPRLQGEIDSFLEDVMGKDQVEAARRERRRRESQTRRRQPAKPKPTSSKAATPKPPAKVEPRRVGSNVSGHVQTYMEYKLDSAKPSQFAPLQSTVGDSVNQHLGVSGMMDDQLLGASAAGLLVGVLSSPASVRQAILINEILSPPLSLRGRAKQN